MPPPLTKEIIEYNLYSDFDVLSDYTFYHTGKPYLGRSLKGKDSPKFLSSDQDGVWEEYGTPQLCELVQQKLRKENNGIKQNFQQLMDIFEKPDIKTQEKEIAELYMDCNVSPKQFLRANHNASTEFQFVKNSSKFVSTVQWKLGYRMDIYSGSPQYMVILKEHESLVQPLALEKIWKKIGLTSNQINGSGFFFSKDKIWIELMLGPRKRRDINTFLYYLVFTDNIVSDRFMMECGIDLLPIGLLFGENLKDIPSGILVPFPEGRDDAMERLKPILKIERGLIQSLGMSKETIKEARNIAEEIKNLYTICLNTEDVVFNRYKKTYADKSLNFLNVERVKLSGRDYNLFPERETKIRESLNRLKYFKNGKGLVENTFKILEKYSPEFHKSRVF